MIKKTIFRVRIVQCSCSVMWYKNNIGKVLVCERVKNEGRLFAHYTASHHSYKALKEVEFIQKTYRKEVITADKVAKYIDTLEPLFETHKITGWILDEDAEILNYREVKIEN